MVRNLVLLILAAAVFWLAVQLLLREQQQVGQAPAVVTQAPGAIVPLPGQSQPNRVADISAHSVDELQTLFDRVEELLDRPRSGEEAPLISLVLHGPEIEYFALKNYAQYKLVVDRAAKLAALGVVQINICQTKMRQLGIASDEVPAFLNQVPFGPAEVEQLVTDGYVYM